MLVLLEEGGRGGKRREEEGRGGKRRRRSGDDNDDDAGIGGVWCISQREDGTLVMEKNNLEPMNRRLGYRR